jgi:hypothetical protein
MKKTSQNHSILKSAIAFERFTGDKYRGTPSTRDVSQ